MAATDPSSRCPMLDRQAAWVDGYRPGLRVDERGSVVSVGDGIVWISGLPSAAMDDMLALEDGSYAMVFDLTESLVGGVLLHETEQLASGTSVRLTGHAFDMPVGDELVGRVVDPLGRSLDGMPDPASVRRQPLEAPAPPIVARDFVSRPLYTGIRIVDTLIPIGRGQRQLVIGDEGLGRSSIAIDTVINQQGGDVLCVYVLIGQKRSTVVNTVDTLRRHGALEYSTVVVAEASALPGLQHLAGNGAQALKSGFNCFPDRLRQWQLDRHLEMLLQPVLFDELADGLDQVEGIAAGGPMQPVR